MIGGGIETGEEPTNTIRREVLEETNYLINNNDKLEYIRKYNIRDKSMMTEVYFSKAHFPGFDKLSDSMR
jgi:8-oxo-dGTP pyrophosphatase MutT (NUDIX family)